MSHRGRCRRRPRCRRHASRSAQGGILKKSSFSTSRLMSTKGNRESIIEEREKEKEVFEDAEEEMVG